MKDIRAKKGVILAISVHLAVRRSNVVIFSNRMGIHAYRTIRRKIRTKNASNI